MSNGSIKLPTHKDNNAAYIKPKEKNNNASQATVSPGKLAKIIYIKSKCLGGQDPPQGGKNCSHVNIFKPKGNIR